LYESTHKHTPLSGLFDDSQTHFGLSKLYDVTIY
jgi:hypothetical protein